MMDYVSVSTSTSQKIKEAMIQDEQMQCLIKTVQNGWPDLKSEVPDCIKNYFNFREEITTQDGLLFKGDRLIIPESYREEIKAKLHYSHLGVTACLRRAQELVYWPGMYKEVENYISMCVMCVIDTSQIR